MAVLAKVKGTVYASKEHRIKLEEMYKKAWQIQNKKDLELKPELKFRSVFKTKSLNSERPLSKNATVVNNMLLEGKEPNQIAKTLLENLKFIMTLIEKYDLPRK